MIRELVFEANARAKLLFYQFGAISLKPFGCGLGIETPEHPAIPFSTKRLRTRAVG